MVIPSGRYGKPKEHPDIVAQCTEWEHSLGAKLDTHVFVFGAVSRASLNCKIGARPAQGAQCPRRRGIGLAGYVIECRRCLDNGCNRRCWGAGTSVGSTVGTAVGSPICSPVGSAIGSTVGSIVGSTAGSTVA